METVVLMRMVPDVVEELEVAADGKSLDDQFLRMIANESDEHALEEALLLKERYGGRVTVVGLEAPELEETLYSALAKGADRAVKLTGVPAGCDTRTAAGIFSQAVKALPGLGQPDLILTGTQAIIDLDSLLAPLVASRLNLLSAAIVTRIELNSAARAVTVTREFPAGFRGEFEVPLPAVIGIQAAEKPPRYVPVAKIRAVMKSQAIESFGMEWPVVEPKLEIQRMAKPVAAERAEIIEGTVEEMAAKLCAILGERGLL